MDPKTDILLGVSNAADPARIKEAVGKLRALSVDQGEFASMLNANRTTASGTTSSGPEDALTPPSPSMTPGSKASTAAKPNGIGGVFNQLEAFIMQTFIQSMLPKDAPAVYGKGTAGDVWKGMLAEKMGNEVAKSGQLGIAKRLGASSITTGTIPRNAPPSAVMSQNMMMAGLVNKPMAPAMPAPAGFAQALTSLQETQASKQPAKTLHAWATTVENKTLHSWATTVEKEQG